MLRHEPKQSSFHFILYDKIPEIHTLKKISLVVDFSFINKLLGEPSPLNTIIRISYLISFQKLRSHSYF
jgi:hypothetical protein